MSVTDKAVIFDWGGVLMRTVNELPRRKWEARLGLPSGSLERIVHGSKVWQMVQMGQRSVDSFWASVGEELRLDRNELAELRADFYRGDAIDTRLLALIRYLRTRHIRIGLLSNNGPDLARQIETLGLASLFDACVISCDLGIMKPAPEAYQAVLDALAVSPSQAAFVDDSEPNVRVAAKLGLWGIHLTPGLDLRAEVEAWLGA
jgi:epoxide hydrolase-like predicted phosphatase